MNHYHPRIFCAKFGWNWPCGSGEEDENVKSLRQRRRQRRTTEKFWSEKLTWVFGSGELKTGLFRFYFGVYQYHWLGNFISQSEKNFDIQFHVLDNEGGSRSILYWKKVDKRCIFYLIFVSVISDVLKTHITRICTPLCKILPLATFESYCSNTLYDRDVDEL